MAVPPGAKAASDMALEAGLTAAVRAATDETGVGESRCAEDFMMSLAQPTAARTGSKAAKIERRRIVSRQILFIGFTIVLALAQITRKVIVEELADSAKYTTSSDCGKFHFRSVGMTERVRRG